MSAPGTILRGSMSQSETEFDGFALKFGASALLFMLN